MKTGIKRISVVLVLALGLSAVSAARPAPARAGKLEKIAAGVTIVAWLVDKIQCQAALWDANHGWLKTGKRYDCPFTDVKFDGQNLRGIQISYQDMSRSSFVGTDLTGASLYGSLHQNHNMEKANLKNADITYAEGITSLKDATLTGATVTNAQLSNTILDGVISGGIINVPDKYHQNLTLPSGWVLTKGYLVGPKAKIPATADFTDGTFGGANLSGLAISWNFTKAKFGNANLTGAKLTNANLTGADLSGANLSGLVSSNIVASATTSPLLLPPGWVLNSGRLIGPGANLLNIDLTNLDFSLLKPENLVGVTSSGLVGTAKALPAGYRVIDGQLVGPGVVIKNINLNNCDLSTMDLRGLTSSGVIGTPKALPTGWKLVNGFLIGPGANLSGVTGSRINFDGLDLTGTSVVGLHASGLTGSPRLDPGVKIVKGYLLGPGADLTGFDLSGADLSGVNLAGANLKGVKSGGITGVPDLGNEKYNRAPTSFGTAHDLYVSNWRYQNNPLGFYNGYLIGPGADLSGADLSGMTIPCGMDFRNTNLTNATLKNIYFESWRYSDSQKPGPHMDSRGFLKYFPFCIADFTGANFKGVKSGGNFGHKGWGDDSRNYSSPFNPGWPLCSWAAFNARVQEPFCKIRDGQHEIGSELGQVSGNLHGKTIAPKYKFLKGQIIGPGVDLRGLDFSGANLTGYDISNTNLSGLNIDNADLSSQTLDGVYTKGFLGTPKAIPSHLTLVGDYFLGRGADLTSIDLSNKDLRGMDLTGVNLTDANIAGAQFAGATLTNIVSKGVRGTPLNGMGVQGAPVNGTILYNGYVLTKGAVIGDADLSNANLEGVNLDGVDFSAVKLDGVRSGIIGTPSALSEQWDFYNGLFIGPDAKLNGYADKLVDADLTGDYLEGIDFSGSNLSGVSASLTHGTPKALPDGWKQFGDILIGPGANLSYLSLAGLDLRRMDLTGANLNSTNLHGTQMDFATKLTDVKSGNIFGVPNGLPDNTKIFNGYLVGPGVNLANANLGAADFTGVSLSGVSSGGVTGSFTNLPSAVSFVNGYFIGRGANLSNSSFIGTMINLKGLGYDSGTLSGLRGANITYDSGHSLPYCWIMFKIGGTGTTNIANLVGPSSDNTGMNFRNYDFSAWGSPTNASCFAQYDFTGADLYGARSNGQIKSVRGLPTGWKLINGWLVGPGANLTGANLTKTDFRWVDLTNVNLTGANLAGTSTCALSTTGVIPPAGWKVVNKCLVGPGAKLDGADLTGADLKNMNLSNTKFNDANLTDAILTGANLSGVSLLTANLTRVKSGSITQGPYQLPPGYWRKYNGYLVGPTANLEGANFSGLNLDSSYWNGTNLRGADFSNSTLKNVSMSGADATNAKFVGSTLRMSVQGTKLVAANFTNASFVGGNICGADFTGATFTGVTSANVANWSGCSLYDGSPVTTSLVLPTGVKLVDETWVGGAWVGGTFVGGGAVVKNANLTGVDFSNLNLSGYDFTGANLSSANFSGATLTGTIFTGANLTGVKSGGIIGAPSALPAPWKLIAGSLVGPKADLSSANLNGVDLSGATLTDVKFGQITGNPSALPVSYKLVKRYIVGPGVDLSGVDLSGANLQGVNLTGANLSGANLSGANLFNAVLSKANLTDANLSQVSLYGLNLSGANLSGANLAGSNLSKANLDLADVHAALLTGANLKQASLDRTNLTDSDLSGVDLSSAFLGRANLTRANLSSAKVVGANAVYVDWTGANLTGTQFAGTSISWGAARQIIGTPVGLPAGLTLVNGYIIGPKMDLTGADFTDVNLGGINLSDATLAGVYSGKGSITGTPAALPTGWKLISGYLVGPGANLGARHADPSFICVYYDYCDTSLDEVADLSNLDLSGMNLTGTRFTGAILNGTNFTNAVLVGADMSRTDITDAVFDGAKLNKTGSLTGSTGASFAGADISEVDFSQSSLSGVNFTGATLTSVNLAGVNLSSANFTNVTFTNVTFTNCSLENANLTGTLLTNVTLTGGTLKGATLSGVDLSKTTLTGVTTVGVTGTVKTPPTGWQQFGTNLVGPGTDLAGASLASLNLSGASLTGVKSGSVTGTPTLPTGWKLVSGYLVGPSANLTGANLTGANLTGANLTGANLTGANLTNATFTGATLTGVTSSSLAGTPSALPTGWALSSGYLVGPGVTITGPYGYGATLLGDLSGVNLTGARIRISNYSYLTTTLPSGSGVVSGWLVGPGANLSNLFFDGSFSGLTLTGINFTGAAFGGSCSPWSCSPTDFSYANFDGVELSGATFRDDAKIEGREIAGTPKSLPRGWTLVNGELIGPMK